MAVPRRLVQHGSALLNWDRHAKRYNKWRKTMNDTWEALFEDQGKADDLRNRLRRLVPKKGASREEIDSLRSHLKFQNKWNSTYHYDLHFIRSQQNLELRRKMRIRKQLKRARVKASVKSVQKLKKYLAEERARTLAGQEPLGGNEVHELLAQLDDQMEEEATEDWPPDDGEEESDLE